jgi:hypothetical protein
MAEGIVAQKPVQSSTSQITALLPAALQGTIGKLACKCTPHDNADFLIKKDRIVCASCALEIVCTPPLLGVFKATFVLDSAGAYVCTWCGAVR